MSLLRNLVGVIVLLAAGILATTIFGARSAVTEFAHSVINVSIELTQRRLHEFFDPITRALIVGRQWGVSGVFNREDPERMRRLLQPVLEEHAQVSAVIVADEVGREYMLMRTYDGFSSREVDVPNWGSRTRWRTWSDDAPAVVEEWREIEYDPRTRPWFEGAVMRGERAAADSPSPDSRDLVHWTAPYTFFTVQRPGMTAAVTYHAPDGTLNVLALDIELSSISQFTESLHVTEHGGVIVLTQDTRVVGLPPEEQFEDDAARQAALLRQPEDLGLQMVIDAAPVFRATLGQPDRPPVQFESGGETWWGKGQPFVLGPDQFLRVGVAVPERDMITNLWTLRFWIIVVTTCVLIAAMLRALILARRFSRPIESLVQQSDDISRGDLEGHEPIESHIVEVQALAEAQDHMRRALRSLMKMERDMQLARQIQQQSFPARLPRIAGYKIEGWADPADETGGDIYDVMGFTTAAADGRGTVNDPIQLTNDNPRYTILVLADATGHGIGPALAVSQFRAMVRMAIRTGRDLQTFAQHINDQLCVDLPQGRFVTAWIAMLDAHEHVLHSFSAGHAPLFHFIAQRGACDVLDADTMPFGVTRNLPIERRPPIALSRGDFFIVCSDGIMEMKNPRHEQFGKQRLLDFITQHRDATPAQWMDALKAALEAFTEGQQPADDITALVLKRM